MVLFYWENSFHSAKLSEKIFLTILKGRPHKLYNYNNNQEYITL